MKHRVRYKPYPLYEVERLDDLKKILEAGEQKYGKKTVFRYGRKIIDEVTYYDFCRDVEGLGTYFHNEGFVRKHIAIIGENTYEWLLSFFAVVNSGNVAIPIDKEMDSEKIDEFLNLTECDHIIISDVYADILEHKAGRNIVLFSEVSGLADRGKALIMNGDTWFTSYAVDNEQTAAIFFTSGTTGAGKAVMLSSKNIAIDMYNFLLNYTASDSTCLVLPFHHALGLMAALCAYTLGMTSYLVTSLKRFSSDIQRERPYVLCVVPLFVETFYKKIIESARKDKSLGKLKVLTIVSRMLLCFHIDIRRKLFKRIHDEFGGKLRYLVCGGAALNIKIEKAFDDWGIEIMNGYGVTECSPIISMSRNKYYMYGSVGLILPEFDVKIAEDGEILCHGDNVMQGYYKDESVTREVIENGWFHTGDLGYIDKKGFLFITGRKKNLIILSNGENISPEEIEMKFSAYDVVQEVMVYEEEGHIVAEIYPADSEKVDKQKFEKLKNDVNSSMSQNMQVHEIYLRKTPFEKNSSGKIIRK